MDIYIYAFIYICIHICIYKYCLYSRKQTNISILVSYMYIYICTYIYIYICWFDANKILTNKKEQYIYIYICLIHTCMNMKAYINNYLQN